MPVKWWHRLANSGLHEKLRKHLMALLNPKLQDGEWPPGRCGKRADFLRELLPPHQTDNRLAL